MIKVVRSASLLLPCGTARGCRVEQRGAVVKTLKRRGTVGRAGGAAWRRHVLIPKVVRYRYYWTVTGSSQLCFSSITSEKSLGKKTKEKVVGFSYGFQWTQYMVVYGCHCACSQMTCFGFLNLQDTCMFLFLKNASCAYKVYSTTHQTEHLK